jgi:hypothetical protein
VAHCERRPRGFVPHFDHAGRAQGDRPAADARHDRQLRRRDRAGEKRQQRILARAPVGNAQDESTISHGAVGDAGVHAVLRRELEDLFMTRFIGRTLLNPAA